MDKRNLYEQFFKLIKKAAYLKNKDAMYEYALQFENVSFLGVDNPLFNPKRRNFWYHKAIESGHPEAYIGDFFINDILYSRHFIFQ